MRLILRKVGRRILYYTSSGSPLRYPLKWIQYLRKPAVFIESRRIYRSLSLGTEQIVAGKNIRENGFSPYRLDLNSTLSIELSQKSALKISKSFSTRLAGRKFFGELLTEEDFHPESIFIRFALQNDVLSVVSNCLGQIPRLFSVSLLCSQPADGQWSESQLWHRDYDDSRIIKLFVYLSDVEDDRAGPFTFIPRKLSKSVGRDLVPRRISDVEMSTKTGLDCSEKVYGKSGTAFFVDTAACYHLGSRCIDKTRVAYVATYTTMAPLDPPRIKALEKAQHLELIQKLTLGLR